MDPLRTALLSAACLVAHVASAAQADIVEYEFEVELLVAADGSGASVGETFTGSFTFDDDFGAEIFADTLTFDVLSFEFEFLGETFDAGSIGVGTAALPQVDFDLNTGEIFGLFVESDPFLPGLGFSIVPNNVAPPEFAFEFTEGGDVQGSGTVSYTFIPEPATASLLALGVALGARRVRRA